MTAEQLWSKFAEKNGIKHNEYEAWQFGDAPDKLAELVLRGIKTGTASAEELYKSMGKLFVPGKGHKYFIITADEDFEKCFGRPADKRRKLYNGMLKCQFYMYFRA